MSNPDHTFRCSLCSLDWPMTPEYKLCKKCGERTTPFSNIEHMPVAEAKSLTRHFDFERYYEKHGAKRATPTKEIRERFTLEKWKAERAAAC